MNIDSKSTYSPGPNQVGLNPSEIAPSIDWSRTSVDYAKHRAGFPPELFRRLTRIGVGGMGQSVLDVGTGTGTLAIGLAGWGARVVATDVAVGQLDAARRLARRHGVAVEFAEMSAERMDFDDDTFDAVTAGQCWHWFDRPRAALEVRRVLMPGGRIVLAHFDFQPGPILDATRVVVDRHRRLHHLASKASVAGFYPLWLEDLKAAGFIDIETFTFDVDTPYTRDSWRGRMRASAWIGASLDSVAVQAFDHELRAALEALPETFTVPHRVFVVHARKPG